MLRIVIEGEERYEIDGRPYRLTAGRMMFIPEGAPMSVRTIDGTRSASMELPSGDTAALPGAILLPLVSHPVGEWLETAARTLHGADDIARTAAASEALRTVSAKVADLARDCLGKMAKLDTAKDVTRLDLLGRVEAARAHLDANLHRAVPLWELEEASRLSGFHFSRAFRDVCGTSPASYHRRLRMERAAQLLQAGQSPAKVAKMLGFATQASFTRAFSRHHGISPGRAS